MPEIPRPEFPLMVERERRDEIAGERLVLDTRAEARERELRARFGRRIFRRSPGAPATEQPDSFAGNRQAAAGNPVRPGPVQAPDLRPATGGPVPINRQQFTIVTA